MKLRGREIMLQIDDVQPFVNEKHEGFIIRWSGSIGFGDYVVYRNIGEHTWLGDSECMDCGEDKAFITELLRLFADGLVIE